jgi:hypothetical protein
MILFYNSIDKDKEFTLAWGLIQEFTEEQMEEILQENHDLVGHPGIQKTYDRIRDLYLWIRILWIRFKNASKLMRPVNPQR